MLDLISSYRPSSGGDNLTDLSTYSFDIFVYKNHMDIGDIEKLILLNKDKLIDKFRKKINEIPFYNKYLKNNDGNINIEDYKCYISRISNLDYEEVYRFDIYFTKYNMYYYDTDILYTE